MNDVPGMMTDDEIELLSQLASERNPCIEVGAYMGRSAIALAARIAGPVYSVDSFEDYLAVTPVARHQYYSGNRDIFLANIEASGLNIVHIHKDSLTAAAEWDFGQVGLILIDARHDYENVRADVDAWIPHLREGGYLVLHDTDEPGVAQVCRELEADGWMGLAKARVLVAYWKPNTASDEAELMAVTEKPRKAKAAAV